MISTVINRSNSVPDRTLLAISNVVQKRREHLRLTQEELAKRAGLHRTYISDIERGARNLSVRSLIRLALALDMRVSDVMKQAEEKTAQEMELAE